MSQQVAEYPRLMMGAHRRPAPRLKAPLLTRQLSLWRPRNVSGVWSPESLVAWKQEIDRFIETMVAAITTGPRSHEFSGLAFDQETRGPVSLFNNTMTAGTWTLEPFSATAAPGSGGAADSADLVALRFEWFGLPIKVRVELHTEYWELTAFIDLSSAAIDPDVLANASHKAVRDLLAAFATIDEELARTAPKAPRARALEAASCRLYIEVWAALETVLFDHVTSEALGAIFGDFRGVVLLKNAPHGDAAAAANGQLFIRPTWHKRATGRSAAHAAPPQPSAWADTLERLWPLAFAPLCGIPFKSHEFTATQMLGGRALYVSALGIQPLEIGARGQPLFYLMVAERTNDWAMGRLLDRLHTLGSIRLAALKDIQGLRQGADELSHAEISATAATAAANEIARISSQDERYLSSAGYTQSIRDFKTALAQSQDALTRADACLADTLAYRLERSRYYIDKFRAGTKALLLAPVPGHQPYDDFVERRLGPTFGFIEMLGGRYRRVRRDIVGLYQQYVAHETRRVWNVTSDANREIRNIQRIGDLVLFSTLLPYYMGTLVSHILWPGAPVPGTAAGHEAAQHPSQIYWLLCFTAGIFAICLRTERDTLRTRLAKRGFGAVCILLFGMTARTVPLLASGYHGPLGDIPDAAALLAALISVFAWRSPRPAVTRAARALLTGLGLVFAGSLFWPMWQHVGAATPHYQHIGAWLFVLPASAIAWMFIPPGDQDPAKTAGSPASQDA